MVGVSAIVHVYSPVTQLVSMFHVFFSFCMPCHVIPKDGMLFVPVHVPYIHTCICFPYCSLLDGVICIKRH